MIQRSRFPLKTSAAPLTLLALLAVGLLAGCGKNKGKVYFGNLSDGAQVESPFTVEMRAENLTVEPATQGVTDGHGHFHILVDTPVPMSMDPIPNDAQHIHYGEGQTEAVLDLPEGEHTLILQFAKGDHRPYDPQITQEIRVRVTKRNAPVGGEGMENGADAHEGHGADGAGGYESNGAGGSGSATDAQRAADSLQRTGDPRNIQPAPGSGMGTGSGSSGSSGSSGGGAM
jgi:hypothetical protein